MSIKNKSEKNNNQNWLIIILIISITILGYGYMNYTSEQKAIEAKKEIEASRVREEKAKETRKKLNLEYCQFEAENDYNNYWNAQCKIQGLNKTTDGCSLPKYIADGIEERREKALENCIKLYRQ